MNREILFRGKDASGVLNYLWQYGSLDNSNPEAMFPIIIRRDRYGNKMLIEVNPKTVGQYTGLKDKNGTKIFEGDIVKTDEFNEPNKLYVIKYDEQMGAFIGDNENFYFVTFDGDSNQFELIGNVYDNPEFDCGENMMSGFKEI